MVTSSFAYRLKEHVDRFFREDVRDLGAVRDISRIEILADLLPDLRFLRDKEKRESISSCW